MKLSAWNQLIFSLHISAKFNEFLHRSCSEECLLKPNEMKVQEVSAPWCSCAVGTAREARTICHPNEGAFLSKEDNVTNASIGLEPVS